MQLLESKMRIWDATVHIKAELDFFIPGQLNKANEQSRSCNKTRFIPYCLIFTAALST